MSHDWIPFELDFSKLAVVGFDAVAPGVELTEEEQQRAREAFFAFAGADLLAAIAQLSAFTGTWASEESIAHAASRVRWLEILGCSPPTCATLRDGRLEAAGLRFYGRITPVAGVTFDEAVAAALPLLTVWLRPDGQTCVRHHVPWFLAVVAAASPTSRIVEHFPVDLQPHETSWSP